jgi:hypothetical protein
LRAVNDEAMSQSSSTTPCERRHGRPTINGTIRRCLEKIDRNPTIYLSILEKRRRRRMGEEEEEEEGRR